MEQIEFLPDMPKPFKDAWYIGTYINGVLFTLCQLIQGESAAMTDPVALVDMCYATPKTMPLRLVGKDEAIEVGKKILSHKDFEHYEEMQVFGSDVLGRNLVRLPLTGLISVRKD